MSSDTEWQPVYISLRKSCSFWKYLKPSSGVYYSETRALKNFSGRLKWDVWFSRGYRNITHLPIFKLSTPPPETVPPLFLACSRSSDSEEWLRGRWMRRALREKKRWGDWGEPIPSLIFALARFFSRHSPPVFIWGPVFNQENTAYDQGSAWCNLVIELMAAWRRI